MKSTQLTQTNASRGQKTGPDWRTDDGSCAQLYKVLVYEAVGESSKNENLPKCTKQLLLWKLGLEALGSHRGWESLEQIWWGNHQNCANGWSPLHKMCKWRRLYKRCTKCHALIAVLWTCYNLIRHFQYYTSGRTSNFLENKWSRGIIRIEFKRMEKWPLGLDVQHKMR